MSQRPSGHVSLRQTAHLRSHSSVNSSEAINNTYLRNGNAKEPSVIARSVSGLENGSTVGPYGNNAAAAAAYAVRRRDTFSRPFSPIPNNTSNSFERSYSPYRQNSNIQQHYYHNYHNHQLTNGSKQVTDDMRSYSPYRGTQSLAEAEARPYSPYCGRDSSRDRWQTTTAPRSLSPFARDYSPWRRENVDPPCIQVPDANDLRYTSSTAYSSILMSQSNRQQQQQQQIEQAQNLYASPMLSRKRWCKIFKTIFLLFKTKLNDRRNCFFAGFPPNNLIRLFSKTRKVQPYRLSNCYCLVLLIN